MSTEFVSTVDDTTQFVRWGSRSGVRFEFGTVTNFERVCSSMDRGEVFVPVGSPMECDPRSRSDLERMVVEGRVSFGEFPVTVSVGSGEMFRFTVEE